VSDSLFGLYGGTFDPVHNGHLDTVLSVLDACQLEEICWIPTGIPAHRQPPMASAVDRYHMVNLALRNYPQLHVSRIEVDQKKTCFTYDTLTEMRAIYPGRVFCFILGLDALLEFESWYRWSGLLTAMHLIVMDRPGMTIPRPLPGWWHRAKADSMDDLRQSAAGRIYSPIIKPCAISSSQVRDCLANNADISHLVPNAVREYINTYSLYQYDPKSQASKSDPQSGR